jgi:hypothetical protein
MGLTPLFCPTLTAPIWWSHVAIIWPFLETVAQAVITKLGIDRCLAVGGHWTMRMRWKSLRLITATAVAWCAGASLSGAQSLRDLVREHGDISVTANACGGLSGLKEIVENTQLTVEGTVTLAESRLTAEEDEVYTEYEIDVVRLFRAPTAATTRSTPGQTELSPFIPDASRTRPSASTRLRVRLRSRYNGRVTLDGGVVTATSGSPTLSVGQHVIVSAYFDKTKEWWVPFGLFEVRKGRVLKLDARLQTKDYESAEEFALALANPPPTTVHVKDK